MKRKLTTAMIAAALCSAGGVAQVPVPESKRLHPFALTSGVHAGAGDTTREAYNGAVIIPGAASMRIVFEAWKLGDGSHVLLRSLEDEAVQRLNAAAIADWKDGSAYFNGDAVEVVLVVAPGDTEAFVSVRGALVDELGGSSIDPGELRTICGPIDNRVRFNDPRVGRFPGSDTPPGGGCTGWILVNGALLTAGHCGPSNNSLIEFNVPSSDSDGTLNHPGPADQYRVIGASVINDNNGRGDDWSIFQCNPNTETGLTPIQAQGDYFRGTIDGFNPEDIRITGYGYDDIPAGSAGDYNSDHKTCQTSASDYVDLVDESPGRRYHRYRTDTRPANSGGPIIIDGTTLTFGIHTHAGCNGDTPESGANSGTSFTHVDLRAAVNDYLGTNVRYADAVHPAGTEVGTVLQPHRTVVGAYNVTPDGGRVYIVNGSYSAASGNAALFAGRDVLLTAPLGTVTIGN